MDKEQIIQMAREAGWESTAEIWYPFLERFADAIRAATKEEDAKICENTVEVGALDMGGETFSYASAEAIRASK